MFNYYYYRNFILFTFKGIVLDKPLYDEGYTKKIFLLFYFFTLLLFYF